MPVASCPCSGAVDAKTEREMASSERGGSNPLARKLQKIQQGHDALLRGGAESPVGRGERRRRSEKRKRTRKKKNQR